MASIEDRWFTTVENPGGKPAKVATPRNGTGKRWRAHYRNPAGQQRNRSFDRKADAERYITSVEGSKLAGTYVDPARARVTFGEIAAKWTASKSGKEKSTLATYRNVMEDHVLPRWRTVPLAAIEFEDVQAWIAELVAAGHSGAHIRKIHFVMSGVLQLAVKSRRLAGNPAKGVELPRVRTASKKYLTVPQVEAMATAAGKSPAGPRRATHRSYSQYRLVVFVLAYTGIRWSEMAALRVSAVDLLRKRLHIHQAVVEVEGEGLVWKAPKSHEERWVPIPAFLVRDLESHIAGKRSDDLLFTSPAGDVLRNRNARRAWFDTAAIAAGMPKLTPHELKHTAASLAVSAGANILALAKMLGHADPSITLRIYADLFDDDLDAVGAKLDALRASGVSPALPEAQVRDLGAAR